jgi:hypothetical protein
MEASIEILKACLKNQMERKFDPFSPSPPSPSPVPLSAGGEGSRVRWIPLSLFFQRRGWRSRVRAELPSSRFRGGEGRGLEPVGEPAKGIRSSEGREAERVGTNESLEVVHYFPAASSGPGR